MPPISVMEDNSKGSSMAMGIIYPPPEVRNIVDKTASFVARNGPEFEHRIKQNEINNPKFNFLNHGDPYHAYYEHRVFELREAGNKATEEESGAPLRPPGTTATSLETTVKQRQTNLMKQVLKEQQELAAAIPPPKDPPPEFEFIAEPPSISALELDLVKLTAQFVARNGRQFLTNLMHREQRNYQFDFLRPQHSLFQYFTKLLEQYTKVLIPPKDLMNKLKEESRVEKLVMDQVKYRVAWIKHQEAKKKKEAQEAERERVSYAQVDWHNFVVVETVDYQPWEVGQFPPPTNPTEVGARVLMQRRVESNPNSSQPKTKSKVSDRVQGDSDDDDVGDDDDDGEDDEGTRVGSGGGANTQVEDMEEESSSEEEEEESEKNDEEFDGTAPPAALGKPLVAVDAAPAVHQPTASLPMPGNVEVRQYDPKVAQATKKRTEVEEEYLVSPITGERVPASKVQEHMRYGLLDPRWVEERDKQITKQAVEDAVYAPGKAIESSLKHLAERRTDIFGVGEQAAEEAAIGKKMGEEEKRSSTMDDKVVVWDGHSSSVDATARAARANVSLNEQIEQIHRNKGLLPTPGPVPSVTDTNQELKTTKTTTTHLQSSQQLIQPRPPQPVAAPPQIPQPVPIPLMPVRAPPPPLMVPPQNSFFIQTTQQPPPQMAFPGVPQINPPIAADDEPPNKRARGEEGLISEREFLARYHPGVSVTFNVVVPNMPDKPEWKLCGQTVVIALPLTDTVSVIKAKLHDELGMPPGKQKLQMDTIFFKDSNTLAYYNITPATVVHLQIKERGGRKK